MSIALAGSEPRFLYLDCGAWIGDGKSAPLQRDFGVVCGRTVVLASFTGRRALAPITEGPAEELAPINRLLATLAGPQKIDVTVVAHRRAPGERPAELPLTPYLFLPDVHLPLVTKLPDVDPDLVPDPAQASCPCHAPVVTRILHGTAAGPNRYRAVGAILSRNPNDWFYLLAESHRPAAMDLLKLVDRLRRFSGPLHVVQLGGLYDVWPTFRCIFQSSGIAAVVTPGIIRNNGEPEFLYFWKQNAIESKNKEAITKLMLIPPARRTILAASHVHGPHVMDDELDYTGAPMTKRLRTADFLAENRPEPCDDLCDDDSPNAILLLREQRARLKGWTRTMAEGWRDALLQRLAARWKDEPFPVYVQAHTHAPALLEAPVIT